MFDGIAAFAVHPELATRLEALRPQLADALAARPSGGDTVLVVVLSRETWSRHRGEELVTQFFGALRSADACRVAGALAPSLSPLLREPPPARCVWCLVLGPRKALVAFPA